MAHRDAVFHVLDWGARQIGPVFKGPTSWGRVRFLLRKRTLSQPCEFDNVLRVIGMRAGYDFVSSRNSGG